MRIVFVCTVTAILVAAVPAQAGISIYIDKSSQSMTVSVDGGPRYHWPVSTGRGGYDTPAGHFRAIRLQRVYYSKKYDNAPMPNSVFFYGGYAIHGTYEQSKLGRPASHGCVRLSRANAATLFELVRIYGIYNTRITIGGNIYSRYRRTVSSNAAIRRARPRNSWSYGTTRYGHAARNLGRPREARRRSAHNYDSYTLPPVARHRRNFNPYYGRPRGNVRRYDDGRGFRWQQRSERDRRWQDRREW
jgi:hypothetical protein